MSEASTKRKRYPSKLSIIAISEEMRKDIDEILEEEPELSEAELVRLSLKDTITRRKKARQKKESNE